MEYKDLQISIAPVGNRGSNPDYRFRINKRDGRDKLQDAAKGKLNIYVVLESTLIETKVTCPDGSFDIQDPEINNWIKHKGFHLYPNGSPTRLIFKLYNVDSKIIIVYCYYYLTEIPNI